MKKLLIIVSFITFFGTGCEQNEGERCEVTSDCASDLVCCIPSGENEGTCQYQENCQTKKK